MPEYDLKGAQAYDPRYLAAWPAELYDVTMAEASLDARSQAYASLRGDMPTLLWPARLLSTSSANLSIEEFRLDLLPVWMTEIAIEGRRRLVLVNGQTGSVQGEGFKRREKSRSWPAGVAGGSDRRVIRMPRHKTRGVHERFPNPRRLLAVAAVSWSGDGCVFPVGKAVPTSLGRHG